MSTVTEGMFAMEGKTSAQLIADELREQIVQGIFRPGQQINEASVASQLNRSRGLLREALQRLCQEGLLVSYRYRGVFVLELETEDIKEIYAVRQSIESAAANTLLGSSQEQIKETCQRLREIVEDMAKQVATSDWQAIARLDMEFHSTFVAGTGNSRLIRIYQTLATESRLCIVNLKVAYNRADVLLEEHQNILKLLEAGDRKGLLEAIKGHMHKAVKDLTTTQLDKSLTA
jgi:DNA-binding GntR family transcriptional regulator